MLIQKTILLEGADDSGGTPVAGGKKNMPANDNDLEDNTTLKDKLSFTKEAFNERLDRASKSAVKKFLQQAGFNSADDFAEYLKNSEQLAKEKKERDEAEMSEIEKLTFNLNEKDATLSKLEAEAKKLKLQIAIRDGVSKAEIIPAQHKTAHALYLQHLSETAEEKQQTPEDFFTSLKEKETMGFLFGTKHGKPNTDTTPPGGIAAGNTNTMDSGTRNANQMSDEEWAEYKQKLGLT